MNNHQTVVEKKETEKVKKKREKEEIFYEV